jgi:ABC-type lipoprotein release transport system permease subunit
MKLFAMAWRNIWRNRRRTLITLSSLAFGVLLAVLSTGVSDWQWGESIDKAARFGGGHVAVQHADYLDAPSLERTLHATPELLAHIEAAEGIERVVPRITGQAVVATAHDSFGASFIAADLQRDNPQTLSALGHIVSGKMLEKEDDILVGEKLAENLSLKLGKKLVYTVTNKDGEIVSGLAHVAGIIRFGSSVDSALCVLPIATVRKTLGYAPDEATQLSVYLRDQRRAHTVAKYLSSKVAPLAARTWADLNPELDGLITVKTVGSNVMQAFVVLLIAAGIFNTLFMSVMERAREFGILLAIGFAPPRLFALVVAESVWIGLVGLLAGVLVTAPLYYRFATKGIDVSKQMGAGGAEIAGTLLDPTIYIGIYWDHALFIAFAIVIVTVIAGLLPAWRATRVEPVEAIRLN